MSGVQHSAVALPVEVRDDVAVLWGYHDMHHRLRPVDVAIALGSHDLGVAIFTAEQWHAGLFPRIVFTGANAPTTRERFPRGEAVHYREHAIELGVRSDAILLEPAATNTAENIEFSRALLTEHDVVVSSVMLISRPYQQRRAYATCRKLWPAVEVVCASRPLPLEEYVAFIGDVDLVVNMLVGDTQRITLYAERGYAAAQPMPAAVQDAYHRLVDQGFDRRLLS